MTGLVSQGIVEVHVLANLETLVIKSKKGDYSSGLPVFNLFDLKRITPNKFTNAIYIWKNRAWCVLDSRVKVGV